MRQVTLNIPENKYPLFVDMINKLGIKLPTSISNELSPKETEFVEGLKDALNEVEQHLQGKIKLQNARDFLNEL